jgi:dCMP deaminase
MKEKMIKTYMKVAQTFSGLSHARRLNVGAIVVKDDRIISIGYNGMPAGWDNNCEDIELMDRDAGGWLSPEEIYEQWPFEGKFWINGEEVDTRYRLVTKSEVLHAESNAIAKLARSNESGLGADIFITHSPCIECAKLIFQSGIKRVWFGEEYRSSDGIDFLKKSGVEVEKLDA